MMKTCLSLVLSFVVVAAISAQSDLTVGGTLVGGGTLSVAVTGAPVSSPTVVFASMGTGSSSLGFGLTIDLAQPLLPLAVGQTDTTGAFSMSFAIPTPPPGLTIPPLALSAQAVTIDLSGFTLPTGPTLGIPTFSFVKSDVESFTITL